MLDGFFGSLGRPAAAVSDRAFAKARSRLHMPALDWLNRWLIERADAAGFMPRWCGMRPVAADASVLMPAIRRCSKTRGLAAADQRLFALFLPGAELTLHAQVHSSSVSERSMLVDALDRLDSAQDVLILDRGFPASWLVNVLAERGLRFVMRCDFGDGGFSAIRAFVRSGKREAWVRLSPPSQRDAQDWCCRREAPTVRLVRQVAPSGAVRVLMTNLSREAVPHRAFSQLYHQRWRIEEAFKRLKLRMGIEAVSGFSQHAVIVDVAAKVLADNIAALLCADAQTNADLSAGKRKCNRSFAAKAIQRELPKILLRIGDVIDLVADLLTRLARSTLRCVEGRTQPRATRPGKPHPHCAYKGG
jgi:hypothetical protein